MCFDLLHTRTGSSGCAPAGLPELQVKEPDSVYDLDITLPMVSCMLPAMDSALPCPACRRHSPHRLGRARTLSPPASSLPAHVTHPAPHPLQVAVVLANFAAFAGVCWLAFRAARSFFALFGPAQPLALAALVAYLALSVWIYSRPVNALELHQKLARKSLRPSQLAQSEKDLRARGKDGKAAAPADPSQPQELQQ